MVVGSGCMGVSVCDLWHQMKVFGNSESVNFPLSMGCISLMQTQEDPQEQALMQLAVIK